MTPKEKAKELVSKYQSCEINFLEYAWVCTKGAKQCALIAVDEILTLKAESFDKLPNPHHYFSINYWKGVKQEIEKL